MDANQGKMGVDVVAFGIAKDIVGGDLIKVQLAENATVADLMAQLKTAYPAFEDLVSVAIAINANYAERDQVIHIGDEIVIIPPVAGG